MDLLLLGKNPIDPDHPAGDDVRYDPDFEVLQSEIDKLSSPSSLNGVDWNKAGKIARSILAGKSKDLLVASYLAISEVHTRKMEGFADGLAVICDLVDQFWESLFPPKKRIRGRLAALEFWIEKSGAALENIDPPINPALLESIRLNMSRLDARCREVFPEPPLFNAIERSISRMAKNSAPAAASELGKPAGGEPVQPVPVSNAESNSRPDLNSHKPESSTAEPAAVFTAQDAARAANSALQKIRQAATVMFDHNPLDVVSYRYRRIAAWAKVTVLPMAVENKTRVPPPAPHEQQTIRDLRAGRNWAFLLKAAEPKVSQFIFWLDLNRFVAEALLGQGEEACIQAHKTVCDETACFLYRLPGLADLEFADGMPFADPETRKWLSGIGIGSAAAAGEPVPAMGIQPVDESDQAMSATLEKAEALARQKKLFEAVELISEAMKSSRSARQTLLWRLSMCRIILLSDKKEVLLPYLELILEDMDRHRLDGWDPGLAMTALKLVHAGFSAFPEKEKKPGAADILHRIARLDPVEALRLKK